MFWQTLLTILVFGIAVQAQDGIIIVADLVNGTIWTGPIETVELQRIPLDHVLNPVAVDYDPREKKIYWSDVRRKTIARAFLNGTEQEVVVSFLSVPDGITVDAENRHLYWTDAGTSTIGRSDLDGHNRRVILQDDLDKPRAIVVDSAARHMYWTDWGENPKIERANLDGSERVALVDTDLELPNGLVVDFEDGRLYWCDARLNRIETTDLNGEDRRKLFEIDEPDIHPFAVGIYNNYIYWSDWVFTKLVKMDRYAGNHAELVGPPTFQRAGGFLIIQDNDGSCSSNACQNGGRCRQLIEGYQCACLPGYTGEFCENRIDIDDCSSDPCLHGGLCLDETFSYVCDCHSTGWQGPRCDEDVNECDQIPRVCHTNAYCTNTIGSYQCRCREGTIGNGVDSCTGPTDAPPPNPCNYKPCRNGATCSYMEDKFECFCPIGFAGKTCEIETAFDGSAPVHNITVSAGEDILIPWTQKDPKWVNWMKDEVAVGATDAAREGRVFVMPEKGLLVLNSEWEDRGWYTSIAIDNHQRVSERVFWVDIAQPVHERVVDADAGEFPCGFPRARGKIVGGKIPEHGLSPWMVMFWDRQTNRPFCGGALLNRRWILTAAHCFSGTDHYTNRDLFEIRLGEYDSEADDGTEVILQAENIIINPNYDRVRYDSDIALVKLRQPITYTDYIVPICLPSVMRAEDIVKSGKGGFITGWGHTVIGGAQARQLRRLKLNIVENCGDMHTNIVTNNMFCAASTNTDKDACQGDSGGPFVIKDSLRWYLVGLVSWGVGCGNLQYPGVYTKVHRFRDWVSDLIGEDMQSCEESQTELHDSIQHKIRTINTLETSVADQRSRIAELEDLVRDGAVGIPAWNITVTSDAWTSFAFRYDDNWNACNGQQYVRRTGYEVGSYVGVVLCSPTRYKIFMSDNLQQTFKNVADSQGRGEDHCELVGATEDTPSTLENEFLLSPSGVGYYRSFWGQQFTVGRIGGGLSRVEDSTGIFYIKWYECGISIP